uniref:Uncharacterized protein n=1 Tax=Rhizophora mucronata TaxID=61149 RepID=A0A2P2ISM0_RHIMU
MIIVNDFFIFFVNEKLRISLPLHANHLLQTQH